MDSVRTQVYYNEPHTEHFKGEQTVHIYQKLRKYFSYLWISLVRHISAPLASYLSQPKSPQNTESFPPASERTMDT
jgi:hypothetical protein